MNAEALQDQHSARGDLNFYNTSGSVVAEKDVLTLDFATETTNPIHVEGAKPSIGGDSVDYDITGESGLEGLGFEPGYKYCHISENDGGVLIMLLKSWDASSAEPIALAVE